VTEEIEIWSDGDLIESEDKEETMTPEEKDAAFQCLLKLRNVPVPVRLTDDQEKAYLEWHRSEERRQMLEAAITALTEGIDPPP
jgi:hypothetical protein